MLSLETQQVFVSFATIYLYQSVMRQLALKSRVMTCHTANPLDHLGVG